MRTIIILITLSFATFAATASNTSNAVRVALMNFTTDDNSYRSAQVALDFTTLLQLELANVADLDWVERAQLDRLRQEMQLSGMNLIAGDSTLRWGRMARADWLITGWFSSDDSSHRTLLLEIVGLNRADVLASDTIKLSVSRTAPLTASRELLAQTAGALRRLLTEARNAEAQAHSQTLVAPLFFAELSGLPRSSGIDPSKAFFESIARAAASRGKIRLTRFPRAFRALDESGMNADGLFGTDQQAWRRTADLYVWGSCESTSSRFAPAMPPPRERRLEITVHAWDGSSKPLALKRAVTFTNARSVSGPEIASAVETLVNQAIAQGRKQSHLPDNTEVRREVAATIVSAYARQFLSNRTSFALADHGTVAQAVQMLDTACFIDPNNSDAHILRIFARWGSGIGSDDRFWRNWRRSLAWGNYVDRFGLKQPEAEFPFGHGLETVAGNYIRSLEDLIRDCPESFKWPENEVYSEVKQAQLHGFPKDISNATAAQWKAELESELAQRKKTVAEFGRLHPESTNLPPSAAKIASRLAELSKKAERDWQSPGAISARALSTVPVPSWLRNINQDVPKFDLSPPDVLNPNIHPQVQTFNFPEQFDVNLVSQLALRNQTLLILATDERRARSSDPNAGIEFEQTEKRGRLWVLEPGHSAPTLFAPKEIPAGIRGFLVVGGKLWIAGETNGWFDFQESRFHPVGVSDGITFQAGNAFAMAGGSLFLSSENKPFTLLHLDAGKWHPIKLPTVTMASVNRLVGRREWLGFVAGTALFYNSSYGTWTDAKISQAWRIAADDQGFWCGGGLGLQLIDPIKGVIQTWPPPGQPIYPLFSFPFPDSQSLNIPKERLQLHESQIHATMKRFLQNHARLTAARHRGALTRPFRLDSLIPIDITALAHDGELLWIGAGDYPDYSLLLVHKPTSQLVAACRMDSGIWSLAVDDKDVWAGTQFGEPLLRRISKAAFLATPRSRWRSLSIPADEQAAFINSMSQIARAKYAFYSGDDSATVALLGEIDVKRASLEELFLLAISAAGEAANSPDLACRCYEAITVRYPDSPWARFAAEQLETVQPRKLAIDQQAAWLVQFDKDRNGTLSPDELKQMAEDPDHKNKQQNLRKRSLAPQMKQIIAKLDREGDGKLDARELQALSLSVKAFTEAPKELLRNRKILEEPLLSPNFPQPSELLQKYDLNKDRALDTEELTQLSLELAK